MKTIAIRYGLIFFAGLTGLFLASYALGLSERYDLRLLNGVIHVVILYYAIKQLRIKQPETAQNYVSGVAQGMYAGGIGTVLFMIFMIIFLALNPTFLASIQEGTGFGDRLTPIMGGVFIFMEGVGVSLIASYLLTRYVDMRMERKANGAAYVSRG